MKPVRACFFCATIAAFVGLVACESSSSGWSTASSTPGRGAYGTCSEAATCNTCTPIVGCGWCQMPDGTGKCVDNPNDCESAKVFTWTWDPDGCRTPIDASSVTVGTVLPDANANDASVDAPDGN